MSDQPQYPTYPGDDSSGPRVPGQQPPVYGQQPPPYGQQPPAFGEQPPPGQAPYGSAFPPQGYGRAPQSYGHPHATTSTMATVGLVLGILSILACYLGVLIGPAAIVVSVLAGKQIDAEPPGAVSGKGLAIAGLVTGIVGTVLWGAVVALTIIGLAVE